MPRTQGAKNKPKTVNQLLDLLKDAAEREGLEFSSNLIKKAAQQAAESGAVNNAESADDFISKFHALEIDIPDEITDADTYKCGKCSAVLASMVTVCPECGTKLQW